MHTSTSVMHISKLLLHVWINILWVFSAHKSEAEWLYVCLCQLIFCCLAAQYEKEHRVFRKMTSMGVRQRSFSELIEYFYILLCHYTLTYCTRSLKLQFNMLVLVPCTRITTVSVKINYNDLCYLVLLYFDRRSSILKVFCTKHKGNLMVIHL